MPSPSRYYSSTAAKTTLLNSISNVSSSLELSAASNLPSQYPYTLILEKDTANEEIVEVTSLVGTAYQINRNIDNSGAKSHAVGALVEHGVSARDFTESRAHEAASNAHNVTGDIVGTSGAQTLASKTLTTPVINGATISGAFTSTATITGGTITGAVVTGLATPTNTSDAATKGYIDTQTQSAAASASSAAVSASSAATSASSALTSASSALTSQTSAATSASSAATSASSAQTFASTMAASVTSAGISASSAATSASSALTSQTSAATSATSAATSATSAAASATTAAASVATISSFATTATNSAAAAATSATSAATSATSADASATTAAASAATAVASTATAVTSAATAISSAATAVTSAAQAATSASSAATSASSALVSQTAAATSASSADTSASSALTSQTAAATSAASALTSQTSAATSASSAATSASSALTSETTAVASASLAVTSATSAATSATSAAISESAALTSAVAAATSATSASVSASSAATSASSAATTYDNFDDRYLGSKSSAPSVDNDGSALLVGAIYWDSTLNNMYVWSGTIWVQIATTSIYSAPTLGSTVITSATTIGTIAGLTLSGGLTTGNPSTALGIANKQYVDEVAEGLRVRPSVRAATTTNLAANYNNGTAGVGATLTADTNRAFSTLDGVTSWSITSPPMGVLVKNQTNKAENGRYNLTTLGSGSEPWVLTRCGLCDESDEIAGSYSFVQLGTVNEGTGWVQIVADPDTFVIGTDDINVYQFSGATYTAGDGLTLTGTEFSIADSYTNDININAIMGVL